VTTTSYHILGFVVKGHDLDAQTFRAPEYQWSDGTGHRNLVVRKAKQFAVLVGLHFANHFLFPTRFARVARVVANDRAFNLAHRLTPFKPESTTIVTILHVAPRPLAITALTNS
jgi:hypothetical protein